MLLPNLKRLFVQDFPKEFQGLVAQLSLNFNYGIEVLYQALNHNLTFPDNMKGTYKEINVQVDSNGFPLSETFVELNDNASRATGVEIFRAVNQTNSNIFPTGAPFISYEQTTNRGRNVIKINHITGLTANNIFRLTIFVHT